MVIIESKNQASSSFSFELSEQIKRGIYKEIRLAKEKAWTEMPNATFNKRINLRDIYKQNVRQKYNITEETERRIISEGIRKGW